MTTRTPPPNAPDGAFSEPLAKIGAALVTLREKRGYSQNDLAIESRVAQSTISRIEAGKGFNITQLLALLKTLQYSAADLFVDAELTNKQNDYRPYKMTVEFDALHVRRIRGNISGPGLENHSKGE